MGAVLLLALQTQLIDQGLNILEWKLKQYFFSLVVRIIVLKVEVAEFKLQNAVVIRIFFVRFADCHALEIKD